MKFIAPPVIGLSGVGSIFSVVDSVGVIGVSLVSPVIVDVSEFCSWGWVVGGLVGGTSIGVST